MSVEARVLTGKEGRGQGASGKRGNMDNMNTLAETIRLHRFEIRYIGEAITGDGM